MLRSGHQRLPHSLLFVAPPPAPPAFDRDHFGPMHRPRSPPITTSRTWPCPPSHIKAGSPSAYILSATLPRASVRIRREGVTRPCRCSTGSNTAAARLGRDQSVRGDSLRARLERRSRH